MQSASRRRARSQPRSRTGPIRVGGVATGLVAALLLSTLTAAPADAYVSTGYELSGYQLSDSSLDEQSMTLALEGPTYELSEKGDDSTSVWQSCDTLDPDLTTTLDEVSSAIGADPLHAAGITGDGVDIAVIDTGVSPVSGLQGQQVDGIDLSFDSTSDLTRGRDLHGHGTSMASIAVSTGGYSGDGVAPGARVVDVRAGANDGAVDVSQIIAAIDWVVANKDTDGRDIRVLNLAYNNDSLQEYEIDPISRAVENAWRAGIVVVVAGGNDGRAVGRLGNPATNPFVLAVGAAERSGDGWAVSSWSSTGDGGRNPDLVAPGSRILAAGVPGSALVTGHVDASCLADFEFYLRGSGTSQAAAVVSGAAALLLDANPWMTPDEVKHVLTTTAIDLGDEPKAQGAGLIALDRAFEAQVPLTGAAQPHAPATGLGSLEAARGSVHVGSETLGVLSGEVTVFGTRWDGAAWVEASESGELWKPSSKPKGKSRHSTDTRWSWMGATWSGATWSGATWSGATWSGATWSGATWSGATWSGATWSGATWSGAAWSGASWTGASWT